MAAGSIVIDLLMKTGSFVTDAGRAEKSLKNFQKSAIDVTGTLKGLLPLLSVGAVAGYTKSLIDASDALNDLSIRTGVAVKDLAALEIAATTNGTSLEALGAGLNKLSRSIGQAENGSKETAQALAALGVTTKDPVEGFLQLADAVTKSTDRTKLNLNLAQVLGKGYQELFVVLSEGREVLERSIESSRVYAEQQQKFAPQAALFNDQLDILKQRLAQVSIQFINQSGLLDALAKAVQFVTENLELIAEAAKTAFFAISLIYSAKVLVGLADLIKSLNLVKITFGLVAIAANEFYKEFSGKNRTDAGQIIKLQNEIIKLNAILATGSKQIRTDKGLQNIKLTDKEIQDIITQRNNLVEQIKKIQSKIDPATPATPPMPDIKVAGKPDEYNFWADATRDIAAFVKQVETAIEPNKRLSQTLQDQLDTFTTLDPALRRYLQSQIDYIKKTEDINKQGEQIIKDVTDRQRRLKELLGETSIGKANNYIQQTTKDLAILNEALEAGEITVQEYTEANMNFFGKTNEKVKETTSFMKELGATFSSAFEQAVVEGQKFQNVLAGLAADIARLFTRKYISDPLMKGIDTIFGSLGDSLGLNTLFSAKGNVFDSSGVKAFATGGIVSGATPFTYGGGNLGVMGEAGPEAILPLGRINGDLGVKAQIGSPVVNINIHEGSGTKASVEQGTDSNGNLTLDIIVEKVEGIMGRNIYKGTGIAPTLERRYGLNRAAGV